MSRDVVAFGRADLSNCDREQIHVPGSIQPHGGLLSLDPASLTIVQAGGDLHALLGADAPNLLGKSVLDVLSQKEGEKLRKLAGTPQVLVRPQHLFSRTNSQNGSLLDATIHKSNDTILLEVEPRLENEPDDSLALVQDMMHRVHSASRPENVYQSMVDEVRAASGFDRVMLYRFLGDGSGAVEAEARDADIEPYLGLHYPASDIPAPARALYLRNWIRSIPDARYMPAPLLSMVASPPALDLSLASLRSVSPIHLEYLANMGVVASMSLSVIVGGKLWGLIACHHRTPRYPSYRLRVALELFAQMASFQLETKLEAEDLGFRLQQKAISESLISDLSLGTDLAEGLKKFRPKLLQYIPAGGVALWIDGQFHALGKTPTADGVAQIVRWLNENMTDGVLSTDRLPKHFPAAARFADCASGIMALSVSRSPRDYVIWFRPELVHTITWAGNPDKSVAAESGRLSPRKSFAAWRQSVHQVSAPWSSLDVRTAQSLRLSLLEIVLQHTDELARERERARVQQQALLAELDRRIAQWETIAQELKRESDRRAVLEEQLSQVLRHTVLEQEAERQRIARELHDSLGQYLTVMRMDLEGISREAEASEAIRRRVEKLKALTTDVGHEVNHLAWEIRPTALDDLGLQMAFQQFLEEWAERSELQFDVHLSLNDRRLPPSIETTLYRVLQEAIRNVVKHAGAKRVGIILEATADEVRMIVEDDGRGFEWDDETGAVGPSKRLGLLGIRERLALVGGSLEVETAPGRGTTVFIHVSL
jgi:light-regulated signal transduction histidine kinase (bacteriophytochrome)